MHVRSRVKPLAGRGKHLLYVLARIQSALEAADAHDVTIISKSKYAHDLMRSLTSIFL